MGIYTKLPEEIRQVDVIVAGGKCFVRGTAGCVIASRLAKADPELSILVIEQGMNNHNIPEVVYPALFPQNLKEGSKTALFWQGNFAPQLGNRAPVVPSGGTLGGGSSINWMVYTRAQRSDFDSWNMPGWSANDLFPYLRKFETYHGRGEREHHGYDGPINISKGTFTAKRAENDFIEAAAKLGYRELKDLQNLDANDGVERWLRYVGPDGRRQDAAHRFLHPKLQSGGYPNLHVLTETHVVRVLIEGGRACGVEYQPNPKFSTDDTKRKIRASKMVCVSAGANATPLILERSGVGNPDVLRRAGVQLIQPLRGVGDQYQDHHLSLWAYRTDLSPREAINGFNDGRFDVHEAIRKNDELLGWNSMDASGKFRPTEADLKDLSPAFRRAWDRDFRNAPDRPLMIIALYNSFFGDYTTLPDDAEYVSMACWTAYPYSRGSIHITGPEISDPIDFDVGYLKDADDVDVQKHIWSYKLQREMTRRMSLYRGEEAGSHPAFPRHSKAAIVEFADGPVPANAPKIQYTKEDDKIIEQKVRETVATTWHSLGTCKMAPREQGGVVDNTLNVYGIKGLKLADLSVPPENVGANTNNTALMIGEKAADIFIKELGLKARL
ncbi:hypothetical protein CKM354_001207200 [Cercospora kikuchii]|uniref:Glucose-methanol-choline oxidoreductase N-terminal domain-containing protein n=1 Tax=Cercospora kikuchii TaxID=84275 RepID=A0A9P3CTH8_9PEZI|nr:uncharacterized protein CKM354_001207200 [Cercospora kikuchii]GIZ49032.1 hypothetical protein CKM354_001207200 [Cercospora kikuchii]